MRILFVVLPALGFAAPTFFVHPAIAAVIFLLFVGVGVSVTDPRPERGEFR